MKKRAKKTTQPSAKDQKLPSSWDEERVHKVLAHYEDQTDDEAVAEDEAAFHTEGQTVMVVPTELVPAVRQLLTRRRGA
jgi:hypothetical protein